LATSKELSVGIEQPKWSLREGSGSSTDTETAFEPKEQSSLCRGAYAVTDRCCNLIPDPGDAGARDAGLRDTGARDAEPRGC